MLYLSLFLVCFIFLTNAKDRDMHVNMKMVGIDLEKPPLNWMVPTRKNFNENC